jgi:NAD(P)-dependent dehydrogenase (short-subunit alcohol dehydrogenase family)
MDTYGFEGRVAVVTGAGRGIGRAYARLLAARGARVVVNDLGGSMTGIGADTGPASEVVAEIVSARGEAIADGNDVASEDGARALVATALEHFGRLDAIVNNAGIIRWAALPEVDVDNIRQHLAVHLEGTFNTVRAAWPHFVDRGYGRIVNTTSSGMFGLPSNLGYAAAKAGVVGLTRSVAVAGAAHGIRCNLVAPAAFTRMAGTADDDSPMATQMAAELVAPMVGVLAHEHCPVTGEIYAAGAGRFARIFVAQGEGYVDTTGAPTIEDVAEHWSEINDETRYTVPADLMGWSAAFLAHLGGRVG